MNQAAKVSLIDKVYTTNNIGVQVPTISTTEIFAIVNPVTRAEFYEAGLQGIQPAYRFDVFATEYDGSDTVRYNGVDYTVYRTYERADGRIELYTEVRSGEK